jgi:hypothetical protein
LAPFVSRLYHRPQIHLGSLLTGSLCLEESIAKTRIGLPALLAAKRQLRFDFLRAWLKWCDEHHRCNQHLETLNTSPTRLISVGDPDCPHSTPDKVRLVVASEGIRETYIALSHCWGNPTDDEKKAFCTTKENLDARKKEFSVAELPKTFRDAIEVARELRTPYLWIDSLCILQGDEEDWKHESARMEDVFSFAYCTVAATSAVDSNEGFLERSSGNQPVYIGDSDCVCINVADFDNDVGNARLNKRSWVMQERFLACRTIHFSVGLIYGECGAGVYCEDLTLLST